MSAQAGHDGERQAHGDFGTAIIKSKHLKDPFARTVQAPLTSDIDDERGIDALVVGHALVKLRQKGRIQEVVAGAGIDGHDERNRRGGAGAGGDEGEPDAGRRRRRSGIRNSCERKRK